MIRRRPRTALALLAVLPLLSCHSARQAPGMDAAELSDDRGARAGRFRPPPDDAADANDTGPADNGATTGSKR